MYSIDNFIAAFDYISAAPFFWQSMGMITAISMIIAVTLYDHRYGLILRSAIATGCFAFILFLVTFFRIDTNLSTIQSLSNADNNHTFTFALAFASLITILTVATFWFLGIILGISVVSFQKRRVLKEKKSTNII